MDEYYQAVSYLPPMLSAMLAEMPPPAAAQIHEIRLRCGCPVSFTRSGEAAAAQVCCPACKSLASYRPSAQQMDDILFSLCGGSLHTYTDDLRRGFLTLPGGHRVGVGGRYVPVNDGTYVLQKAESFNLRIARYRTVALPQAMRTELAGGFTGLLISGEPDSGKTTLLRSLIPYLLLLGRQVAVIDERSEILPDDTEKRPNAFCCDRIAGVCKPLAIEMALRSLAPQVLIVDELGTAEETGRLEQGFFSGVGIIATLHASSLEQARQKPQFRFLAEHGMLQYACQLEGRQAPCKIREETFLCR